jgi:hypothetical protein
VPPLTLIGTASFGLVWGWLVAERGSSAPSGRALGVLAGATVVALALPVGIVGVADAGAQVIGVVAGAVCWGIWKAVVRRYAQVT